MEEMEEVKEVEEEEVVDWRWREMEWRRWKR